jgi:hypothetical protein
VQLEATARSPCFKSGSFLVGSAIASEDRIRRIAAATTIAAFSGYGHNARDIRELLHLLHQAGHALKELPCSHLFD